MFMRYTSVVLVLMLLGIELTFARASLAAGAQLSAPPELHWSACPDVPDTECAGLEVPVDPARPDGVQFTLRLGRARDRPRSQGGRAAVHPGRAGRGHPRDVRPTPRLATYRRVRAPVRRGQL